MPTDNMINKITVMHIITRMDMGGSAQNTLLTCLGLDKSRYRVTLVTGLSRESRMTEAETEAVNRMMDEAVQNGVDITRVPALARSLNPIYDIQALWALWRIIRKGKPDIVHTHTSKAGILGRWAAWLARVPVIVHTPHGHVFYGHFAAFFSKLFLITEKLTAPLTHKLIALTKGERDDYLALNLFASDSMEIIHSGVDIDAFAKVEADTGALRKELGIPEDALVVGSVGWLLPVKNPVGLLDALIPLLCERPELYLVFVGKGELEPVLREKAREKGGGDRVVFAGWRKDIPELMRLFDVFALPSLNEGMGRVVVEAMASGKPVVAADVGGIPDMVHHGKNGYLVDPQDTVSLKTAVAGLLDDSRLRESMGIEGRKTADRFGLSAMISRIEVLYESVLGGRT